MSTNADLRVYDLIGEAKEYLYSLCKFDNELAEEVSRMTYLSILEEKKDGKEVMSILKNIYLDKKEEVDEIPF